MIRRINQIRLKLAYTRMELAWADVMAYNSQAAFAAYNKARLHYERMKILCR